MKSILFSFFFVFTVIVGNAQIVDIPDPSFKDFLLNTNCAIFESWPYADEPERFPVDSNNDGEIQVSEAEAVKGLRFDNGYFLSTSGIEHFTNLEYLYCFNIDFPSLDLSNNVNLKYVIVGYTNQFPMETIDVSNCTNLEELILPALGLGTLFLDNTPNLINIDVQENNLSTINLDDCINLEMFDGGSNPFTELHLENNINLKRLGLVNSQVTSLDLTNNINLEEMDLPNGQLLSLDITNNPNIEYVSVANNPITVINLKNGSVQGLGIYNCEELEYICVDDDELASVQNAVDNFNYTNCVVNSYCSFTAGGDVYSVEGESKVDADLNDCDTNDSQYPNLKLDISDGVNSGSFIANETGDYNISLAEGNYTLIPELENSDYFTVSPTMVSVNFLSDASPYNQDFCITPNGVHNDLEVLIIPITDALPGFDVTYKIVYKNVGNTLLSGNIEFDYSFDSDYMQYVSSSPSETSEMNNVLSWDYVDLAPFEVRETTVTFTLNTPTDDNFPLNSDDELNFEVSISPDTADETPDNNDFGLKHIVINSFDPNDIRCLEGDFILPERVGEYVHYLIRFENLGTANATNIVVNNPIDVTKFDITTLIPLNGSHDFYTRVNPDNDVEFIFENIQLPFDDANNDGYVTYKIKTSESLVLGDTFSNQAEIYFDFNAPIITNTYTTHISEDELSISEFNVQNTKVYPNPVNDTLTIESDAILNSAVIYDINGREILVSSFEDVNYQLNLSALDAGLYFLKVFSNSGHTTLEIVKR